ncbi:MAG: hypothetical protein JO287_18665 [Pseudonocardiales bacterium]|nr:hypothetical protein [Pseudonocardiales bacterium]
MTMTTPLLRAYAAAISEGMLANTAGTGAGLAIGTAPNTRAPSGRG